VSAWDWAPRIIQLRVIATVTIAIPLHNRMTADDYAAVVSALHVVWSLPTPGMVC
jgi:hypothetical protein